MRFLISLIILTTSFNSYGQGQSDTSHIKKFKGPAIITLIDSLKLSILRDTIMFNRTDLLHTNMGTRNTKPYSPVYFVNMKYAYRLDIINGKLVKEFVDNILDPLKIESIDILDTVYSQALFGITGVNGAILITTKKKTKTNFKVAGLTMTKNKKRGDNFNQRQGSEIKILH